MEKNNNSEFNEPPIVKCSKSDAWYHSVCFALLASNTKASEVHHPLGVAAGHLRSLRERGMDAEIASVESGTSV